jgi:predicted kinase
MTTPHLIIIGGFAGSGKSTLAKHLGHILSLPVFEIDHLARSIRASKSFEDSNAYGLAFDVFFAFARRHLQNQGSLILDQNMGHALTWRNLEALRTDLKTVEVKIFILDCPYELCLERVAGRSDHPNQTEVTVDDLPAHKWKWDYLNENDLPQAIRLDATQTQAEIFDEVMAYLADYRE